MLSDGKRQHKWIIFKFFIRGNNINDQKHFDEDSFLSKIIFLLGNRCGTGSAHGDDESNHHAVSIVTDGNGTARGYSIGADNNNSNWKSYTKKFLKITENLLEIINITKIFIKQNYIRII